MAVQLHFKNSGSLLTELNKTLTRAHDIVNQRIIDLTKRTTESLSNYFDTTNLCIKKIFSKAPKLDPDVSREFSKISDMQLNLAKMNRDIHIELSSDEKKYNQEVFRKIQQANNRLSLLAAKLDEINTIDRFVEGTVSRFSLKNGLEAEIKGMERDIVKNVQDQKIGKIVEIFQVVVCGFLAYRLIGFSASRGELVLDVLIFKIKEYIKVTSL